MAILNVEELFSDDQAIIASAPSTNIYDKRQPGTWIHATAPIINDMGPGHIEPIFVQITEDFDLLTSLEIAIQVDDDVAFGSPKTLVTETVLLANLVQGNKLNIRNIPYGADERYVRILYTVTGTDPTAGKVMAGFGQIEETFGMRG